MGFWNGVVDFFTFGDKSVSFTPTGPTVYGGAIPAPDLLGRTEADRVRERNQVALALDIGAAQNAGNPLGAFYGASATTWRSPSDLAAVWNSYMALPGAVAYTGAKAATDLGTGAAKGIWDGLGLSSLVKPALLIGAGVLTVWLVKE